MGCEARLTPATVASFASTHALCDAPRRRPLSTTLPGHTIESFEWPASYFVSVIMVLVRHGLRGYRRRCFCQLDISWRRAVLLVTRFWRVIVGGILLKWNEFNILELFKSKEEFITFQMLIVSSLSCLKVSVKRDGWKRKTVEVYQRLFHLYRSSGIRPPSIFTAGSYLPSNWVMVHSNNPQCSWLFTLFGCWPLCLMLSCAMYTIPQPLKWPMFYQYL